MNINPTPWNGPDIVVNPKFTKGDEVSIRGTKLSGIVRNSEKRAGRYKVFVYRVQLDTGFEMFFENELDNV